VIRQGRLTERPGARFLALAGMIRSSDPHQVSIQGFPRRCGGNPTGFSTTSPTNAFPRVCRDGPDKERTLDKVEKFPRKRRGDPVEKQYAEGHKMVSLLMQG
jgi:hypothetical protein